MSMFSVLLIYHTGKVLNVVCNYNPSFQVLLPGKTLPEHWLSPEVRFLLARFRHEVRRSSEPASGLGPLLPAAAQDHPGLPDRSEQHLRGSEADRVANDSNSSPARTGT